MALSTTFNRLKREIGIKKCVIVEGNVGDVYLNDKKQIVDLKQYLMDMLKAMDYDDVLYWDRIDGVDGDVSRLDVVDKVEVEGDAYSFDDDEEETPKEEQKTGSGLFKEPAEIFNIIFKNLKKPNKKIAFVLNWADYLFSAGGQLPPDERELLTLLGKAIKDKKIDYFSEDFNEIVKAIATSKRWISNAKKDKCIRKFIEKVKPRSAIINSALTGKKICFSPVFEREQTILCLKLIQMIVNHGGTYNTKVSENQYYVKDDADDPEKHGTRYHHFVEVMDENQKEKVISYDDLLGILKTSWKELENMDIPELSKEGREVQEESNRGLKGTTIGEILAARGILLEPDQAK